MLDAETTVTNDSKRVREVFRFKVDFNAGAVINVCLGVLGWARSRSAAKVDEIYDTLLNIFRMAESEGIPTSRAADRLAERRLAASAVQVSPKYSIAEVVA